MTIRRLALVAFLGILCVPAWAAENVAGKWVANVQTGQGSMKMTFDFTVDGMKLMGTVANDFIQATNISEGMIHDNEVSFKVAIPGGPGGPMTISYKGMVKGDEMSLTRTFESGAPQGAPAEAKLTAMREK